MPCRSLAIVGSGPSGCYLGQLINNLLPSAEIVLLDRLPIPYGLIRYGVAADHQGAKRMAKPFARIFERGNVKFMGNVDVGVDVSLTVSLELFDVAVLAIGLSADRTLSKRLDAAPNVYGAGDVTRTWKTHPGHSEIRFAFGETVVVVGNGNVTMNVIRLLAQDAKDVDSSDIAGLAFGEAVRHIHIVGKSSVEQAKIDPTMVRELTDIEGLVVGIAAPL